MLVQLIAGARRAPPRFHGVWHGGHAGFWVLILVVVVAVVIATVLARRNR